MHFAATIVLILAANDASTSDKVGTIGARYATIFEQESILIGVTSSQACFGGENGQNCLSTHSGKMWHFKCFCYSYTILGNVINSLHLHLHAPALDYSEPVTPLVLASIALGISGWKPQPSMLAS